MARVVVFFIGLCVCPLMYGNAPGVLFFDEFKILDNWEVIKQPLVKNQSSYTIFMVGENSCLKAHSANGASSLKSKISFDVYKYPVVKWRWQIENILKKGDVTKKSGDDYPIRIYINFVPDKEHEDPGFMFRYNFVKAAYGLEIPRYSLNYIIESREQAKEWYDNPFDPQNSKIIIKRAGEKAVGIWFDEQINIVQDFKKIFGFDPPHTAYVAVMSDTDNTGEEATAYIQYIGVYPDDQL